MIKHNLSTFVLFFCLVYLSFFSLSITGFSQSQDQLQSVPSVSSDEDLPLNQGLSPSVHPMNTENLNSTIPSSNTPPAITLLSTYISQDPVLKNDPFYVAFDIKIAEGYHLNSNNPPLEFLQPTVLSLQSPEEFEVNHIYYPHPELVELDLPEGMESPFEVDQLPYIQGEVRFYMELTAPSAIEEGEYDLKLQLQYQLCKELMCLGVKTITIPFQVRVGEAGDEIQILHSTVFENIKGLAIEEEAGLFDFDIANLMGEYGLFLTFLILFLFGIALNLTPCVYPMIPITIAFFGNQEEQTSNKRLILLASFYMLGIVLMYTILGFTAAFLGEGFSFLLEYKAVWIVLALLMIALALNQFGLWEIKLPGFASQLGSKGGAIGALFMGLVIGIIAAPCIAAPILGVFTLVAEQNKPVEGFFMFFFMGLGMGLPYLFLAFFAAKINKLPRSGEWMVSVKQLFGLLLIGLAIYFLKSILPETFYMYLFDGYVIAAAIIYFFLKEGEKGKFIWFKRILIVVALIVGGFNLYQTIQFSLQYHPPSYDKAVFESSYGKEPIVLMFSASWCLPCHEIKQGTLIQEEVVEHLKEINFMIVDITDDSKEENNEIKERYNIVGPPTFIFINANGDVEEGLTAYGMIDSEELLARLQNLVR